MTVVAEQISTRPRGQTWIQRLASNRYGSLLIVLHKYSDCLPILTCFHIPICTNSGTLTFPTDTYLHLLLKVDEVAWLVDTDTLLYNDTSVGTDTDSGTTTSIGTDTSTHESGTNTDVDAAISVHTNGGSEPSSVWFTWFNVVVWLLLLSIVSMILSSSFSWHCGVCGSGKSIVQPSLPDTELLLSPVIAMHSSLPVESSFTDACRQNKVSLEQCSRGRFNRVGRRWCAIKGMYGRGLSQAEWQMPECEEWCSRQ